MQRLVTTLLLIALLLSPAEAFHAADPTSYGFAEVSRSTLALPQVKEPLLLALLRNLRNGFTGHDPQSSDLKALIGLFITGLDNVVLLGRAPFNDLFTLQVKLPGPDVGMQIVIDNPSPGGPSSLRLLFERYPLAPDSEGYLIELFEKRDKRVRIHFVDFQGSNPVQLPAPVAAAPFNSKQSHDLREQLYTWSKSLPNAFVPTFANDVATATRLYDRHAREWKPDEREDYLSRLQKQAPQDTEVRRRLAEVYVEEGRLKEATGLVDGIIEQNPQDARAWRVRSRILNALEKRREAEEAARHADDLDRKHGFFVEKDLIGLSLWELERLFLQALNQNDLLDHLQDQLHFLHDWICGQQNGHSAAFKLAKEWQKKFPDSVLMKRSMAFHYTKISEAHFKNRRVSDALWFAKIAYEEDPHPRQAERWIEMAMKVGDYDLAWGVLNESLMRHGHVPSLLKIYLSLLVQRNEYIMAIMRAFAFAAHRRSPHTAGLLAAVLREAGADEQAESVIASRHLNDQFGHMRLLSLSQ